MSDTENPTLRDAVEHWLLVLGSALLIAVGSGFIASTGRVPGWEQGIFHGINGLPDALESPMWLLQLPGLLFTPVIVAAVALVFRKWVLATMLVVFVPIKLFVEKGIVKQLVERQRPGTSICRGDTTCGNFRDVPIEGLSFVSGHAMVTGGIAAILLPYLPRRWRWIPVVIAALNATARVYLGAHNPLDVIGGCAIGVAIGALFHLVRLAIERSRSEADRPNAV